MSPDIVSVSCGRSLPGENHWSNLFHFLPGKYSMWFLFIWFFSDHLFTIRLPHRPTQAGTLSCLAHQGDPRPREALIRPGAPRGLLNDQVSENKKASFGERVLYVPLRVCTHVCNKTQRAWSSATGAKSLSGWGSLHLSSTGLHQVLSEQCPCGLAGPALPRASEWG